MLMPIVSMNQMAMNESVAASCCYKQTAATSNVYWEVLNGGEIGRGYVEHLDNIAGLNKQWLKLANDLTSGTSSWAVDFDGGFVLGDDGVYYITGSSDGKGGMIAVWSDDRFSKGSACKHDDGNCLYKTWFIRNEDNVHFNSKTAHKGDTWKTPHTATQFNS